jgi:hypothetical protein
LKDAVEAIEAGNFDADLGGHVYKQRVARKGEGKRGGFRTVLIYKQGKRAFFVFGFPKNKLADIPDDDLAYYKKIAGGLLSASDSQIDNWKADDSLTEIM